MVVSNGFVVSCPPICPQCSVFPLWLEVSQAPPTWASTNLGIYHVIYFFGFLGRPDPPAPKVGSGMPSLAKPRFRQDSRNSRHLIYRLKTAHSKPRFHPAVRVFPKKSCLPLFLFAKVEIGLENPEKLSKNGNQLL